MSKYFKPLLTILILTVFCSTFVLLHTQISESSDSNLNNKRCIGDIDSQWSPKKKCEGYTTEASCVGTSIILSVISTKGCSGSYEGWHCDPTQSDEEVLNSTCSWDRDAQACDTPSTKIRKFPNCTDTSP